uniref:Ig-like domain-containing protein n=1 Tax=Latimeria chalumnae TaxID=7897 RepID=H3A195_LATCH
TFKCKMNKSKDILQVTWQKESNNSVENMATYSNNYGHNVLEKFIDRVNITELGLYASAIIIENVRLEDEGCYLCLFNTYPFGSITKKQCLTVYAISEPILKEHTTFVSENRVKCVNLSCSATGKPAPEISWNTVETIQKEPQSQLIKHPNGTETVTINAILSYTFLSKGDVFCRVKHPALQHEQHVSVKTQPSFDITIVISVVLVICLVSALLILYLNWKKKLP